MANATLSMRYPGVGVVHYRVIDARLDGTILATIAGISLKADVADGGDLMHSEVLQMRTPQTRQRVQMVQIIAALGRQR